ncbi:hypothetical protein CYJ40_03485 [Brevibacterium ravenspurgense]|uniref:HMP/thiamine permease protein YkoE n=1 Tax=Brevibacterium ravenspurgense TaxID=479117 RepID=A0A2I1IHR2_9MICO|nr:ECF transporter S component [Brevibacterium ravenspurgense]PKY70642.1 hypothetical protein CYJ40_03485 [Brevibacterium ravenspurgense]
MTQDNRVQTGHHTNPTNPNTTSSAQTKNPQTPQTKTSMRWRTVDIIVTVVIAVAVGVIFWGVAAIWGVFELWTVAFPPLVGLFGGIWVLAGPLAGIIVRKPGAAIIAETLAAAVEAVLGSNFGATAIISGLLQGAGAEIVFLAFLYRKWNLPVMLLSGLGAGITLVVGEIVMYYAKWAMTFKVVYAVCGIVSSIIISGLGAWLLWKAIVPTGALSAFASGRTTTRPRQHTTPNRT